LERAVDRLHELVTVTLGSGTRLTPPVETELLAILGELTIDMVQDAAVRAEHLPDRLASGRSTFGSVTTRIPTSAMLARHSLPCHARRAGFDNVLIEEMEFHLRFSDFEDYWSFIREFAGAVAILLRSFPMRSGLRSGRQRNERRRDFERARATISPVYQ
jgi:hypothetical protein